MSTYKITPQLHKQMLICSEEYKKSAARLALSLAYHAGTVDDLPVGMIMMSMLIMDGLVLADGDENLFIPRDTNGEFYFDVQHLALQAVEYSLLTQRNSVF